MDEVQTTASRSGDDCRGLLVEGGGTTSRPRRELETASMSKLLVVVDIIELINAV